MVKNLRIYQQEVICKVEDALKSGVSRQLVCMATGLGKTFTAVKIVEKLQFKHILWITHNEELIQQSGLAFLKDKFDDSFAKKVQDIGFLDWVDKHNCNFGNHTGTFKMGAIKASVFKINAEVTMASAQTLYRRLDKIPFDYFDCIVVDEAHLFLAKTFVQPLEYFKPKLLLGLTATPHRMDGLSLGNIFEQITYEYNIGQGIKDGYLCELDGIRVQTNISLDNVRTTAGELNQKDLADEVNIPRRNQLIVNKYKEYADGRQGIFFCVDIQHACDLADMFIENGISCKPIVGDEEYTPDRVGAIQDFKDRKIQVLTNCQILTTGFDEPNVGVIGNASPTKSLTKYMQCLDDITEILTNDGWKNIDTISKKQKVAAYNKNTQEITFEKIDAIYNRERGEDEDMYSISLPETDIRVTGGHRMLIANKVTRNKILEPYRFENAEDFYKRKKDSAIPISGFQLSKGLPLTNDELIFIGLFLSDGSINKRRNQMYIAQSAHQKWNKDIVQCLENCGIKYRIAVKNRITQYSNDSTMNYYYIGVNEFRNLLPWIDKKLNSNFEEITPSQLEFLIYGINLGDGDKRVNEWKRGTYGISTGNIDFANNLQSLCVRKGMKCSLAKYGDRRYKLHIKPNKQKKHLTFCNDGRDTFKKEIVWKKERVWCVENIKSTLITRRNGKVSILGNCIGRGSRLKDKDFVDRFGQNCIILDFVDSSSRHKLINTWTLDQGKNLEDRVFLTQEKREHILEERLKKSIKVENLTDKDERIVLIQLPPAKQFGWKKMQEAATSAQLKYISDLGHDIVNNTYTKQQCADIISLEPCNKKEIEYLKSKGYDTTFATKGQYSTIFYELEMKNKWKKK